MTDLSREDRLDKHIKDVQALKVSVDKIEHVLFGEPSTQEPGMKAKLDEIYDLLTQTRGVVSFFKNVRWISLTIVAIGAAWMLITGQK